MAHKAVGPGSLVASRFRLEDLLDEHSGARFWRATDLTLARNVAIHVIDADDPRAPAVLTAARTSATVSDGHILRVLDALQEGDVVHVVHEWGAGVSLDRMLADEPLEPRRAAWLVREVAEAITVAHRHGIAHGRLLPENVLLTDAGAVKLIGFVVDAVLHGRAQRSGASGPPPSEHESDVRNLGALLYACLTGRWPGFPESVLPDAPLDHGRVCRPRQVRPGVPKQLDALCEQILTPEHRVGRPRYESAVAIGAALGEFLGEAVGPAGVPVSGPSTFLDPQTLATPPGGTGVYDGLPGDDAVLRAEPEATQPAVPRPAPDRTGRDTGDTGETGPRVPGTGMGGLGEVPPTWGPDPDDSGTWAAVLPDERAGSTWMRLAAGIGVLVLVLLAVVVGFSLGRSNGPPVATDPAGDPSPTGTETAAQPRVVAPAAVTAFDPEGSGPITDENPESVPLATDGDPQTAWRTVGYNDGPVLAPFKSGVGLLLDLGEEQEVADVRVRLVGSGYDVQLLAAEPGADIPSSPDGLTTVDTATGVSGRVTLAGDEAVTTRYLVVWLTAVPPNGNDGRYRGVVSEVVVRS